MSSSLKRKKYHQLKMPLPRDPANEVPESRKTGKLIKQKRRKRINTVFRLFCFVECSRSTFTIHTLPVCSYSSGLDCLATPLPAGHFHFPYFQARPARM